MWHQCYNPLLVINTCMQHSCFLLLYVAICTYILCKHTANYYDNPNYIADYKFDELDN